MRTRSPVRQILTCLFAAAQLSAPTVAAVAHAWVTRAEAADATLVHVEEPGQHHTVHGHPESCALCQVLGRVLPTASDPAAVVEAAGRSSPPSAYRLSVPTSSAVARPSSRAPPAQS